MGAWGIGALENDAALDWLGDFSENPTQAALLEALEPPATDELDTGWSEASLAAAEVVAALGGRGSAALDPGVLAWARRNPHLFTRLLREAARSAVDAVRDRSELAELWKEAGEYEGWRAALKDLRHRLRKPE